ncbi:MAG: ABC transporter substrate-binding protein [Synergistaceae bacterium]|jgi:peptide/nickel transport system substrate-binding protein|nr:ABC transporter substrate-binding protein [Synergistaceae bacterium]
MKKSKLHRKSLLFLALLCACVFAGSSTPALGTEHVLAIDLATESATLDPGLQYNTDSYTVYRNIFDNLLHRDPQTLEIIPWVAESWEQKDELTWAFKIRGDIKFHNGESLKASDVAFSINRILDKSFRSPQYSNYSQITSCEAEDDIVTIKTEAPSPTLLAQLVNLSVVPEKYVLEQGNEKFNLNPVGSGPYKFVNWQKGSQIELTANDEHWKGKPQIVGAVFRFVPNAASRIADLQSGLADVILNLNADNVEALKSDGALQVLSSPTERVAFLLFNCLRDSSPTKAVNVRKAIAYAIDREAIVTSLLRGYGNLVKEVLTPLSFGYDDTVEGFSYDPEKAKQLLKEAGLENVSITFISSPAYDQRVVQAVQGDLAKVGIGVKINIVEQAIYLKTVQDPAQEWGDIRFGIWSSGTMDAHGTLVPLFHTGTLWSSFSNSNLDAALDAAAKITDKEVRLREYKKAFQILQEEVPAIGLWQNYTLSAASKQLEWQPNAQESFFIQDMKWKD